MKMLAIVLARGGSKRLPGKNMRLLDGKTLVQRACECALAAGMDCVVSSDDEATLKHTDSLGCLSIVRPKHLATDEATSENAILHVLDAFRGYTAFCLLQPTSPLRTAEDVLAARQSFSETGATVLISTCGGKRNGAIYMARTEHFLARGWESSNTLFLEMENGRSIDVDTLEDFQACEAYLAPMDPWGKPNVAKEVNVA